MNEIEPNTEKTVQNIFNDTQTKIVGFLKNKDKIMIADLAGNLGLDVANTTKLIRMAINQQKLEGNISGDEKEYFSNLWLRKTLTDAIEKQ